MVRNILGSILALVGAAAAVFSPFRAWYDGRQGRYYRLSELFSGDGVTGSRSGLFDSIFLPLAVAALITLLGILLRSRLMVALAGVIVLGFTILWMVRVGQAQGNLAVDSEGNGLALGVAFAFGGGLLLLLASLLMSGRDRRRRRRLDEGTPTAYEPPPTVPTLDSPPPYAAGYEDGYASGPQRPTEDRPHGGGGATAS
ncbi:hypothetical protein DSC45_28330 [Streptomyces sp. YIM 130001]|uniref:hypothetical protein n=1 Tax=Streptomyces sp. YIM 130001 TaxID=2259644 RepID=UPI000ECB89E7|nr:hypothetical protein [Streptomyces sp. YIM 130001]RII11824.1 hypothetical protein DSC45_28330 [Streptomyces sp. YIM 130001]